MLIPYTKGGAYMGEWLGIVAGVLGVSGYVPYIRDIVKMTTKPDRIAWLIWTFEYTVLFFAQLSAGAHHSLWIVGLQLAGVIVTFCLSLRFGLGTFTKQTLIFMAGVFAALLIWYSSQSAALAILILIAVEAAGVVLTMIKVYKYPGSETLSFWVLLGLAGMLGIPAVGFHAATILYAYPVSLIVMSGGVIIASLLGARSQKAVTMTTLEESSPTATS